MIQKIIDILLDNPTTIKELKRLTGINNTRIIVTYLRKIDYLSKIKGWKFVIIPARCRKCGYVFSKSIGNPHKCPKCKSEWIEPAKFYIIKP